MANASEMSVAFYFKTKVLEIAVGIRVAICKINLVILIDKGIVPGQSEVRFIAIATLTIPILVVLYVLSSSMPTEIFLLRLPLRIDDNFHPHLIQVVHFIVIENVESNFMIFESI